MAATKTNKINGRRKTKWKDDFIFLAYEHAKTGLGDHSIAKALDVPFPSFEGYKRKYPLFAEAIERGRKVRSGKRGLGFLDYVYKQMSPKAQKLWDDICRVRDEPNGLLRMEAMFEDAGLKARQHLFVHALVSTNFNASEACRLVNITYPTVHKWMKKDPDFELLMDEINTHKENFIEGSLMDLIAQRDVGATIFACKTQLANRGYNPGKTSTVNVNGSVKHEHRLSIDELALPLDTRIAIRDAIRAKKSVGAIETTVKRISHDDDDEGDE